MYFCQGGGGVNWWGQNDLSNSEQLNKNWAQKLRQKMTRTLFLFDSLWGNQKYREGRENGDDKGNDGDGDFFPVYLFGLRLENLSFSVVSL